MYSFAVIEPDTFKSPVIPALPATNNLSSFGFAVPNPVFPLESIRSALAPAPFAITNGSPPPVSVMWKAFVTALALHITLPSVS